MLEIHGVLNRDEQHLVYSALANAASLRPDYSLPLKSLVEQYEAAGAVKGDARICAHLQEAGIGWLITENRHFLGEIPGLPFKVLTSGDALKMLG